MTKPLRGVSFGDLHVDERSPRWGHERVALMALAERIVEAQPDFFLCNGDLAGRNTNHRYTSTEIDALSEFFVELLTCCPGYLISGNHDRAGEASLLRHLGDRGRNPLMVADWAAPPPLHTPGARLPIVLQVPYLSEPAVFKMFDVEPPRDPAEATRLSGELLGKAIEKMIGLVLSRGGVGSFPGDTCLIGQMHFPVEGIKIGPYEIASEQDITIRQEFFEQNKHVVPFWGVGHVHARSRIAENAEYAGNPWCATYGEKGPKGFTVFEVEDGGRVNLEHVDLATWDMLTVDIGSIAAGTDVSDWSIWVDPADNVLGRSHADAFVKLRYELPPGVTKTMVPEEKIVAELKRRGGVIGVDFDPSYARTERTERAPEVVAATTDEEKIREALAAEGDDAAYATQLFRTLTEEVPCTD